MDTRSWMIYKLIEGEAVYDTMAYGNIGEAQEAYADSPGVEDGTYLFIEDRPRCHTPSVYIATLSTGPRWERHDA